MEANQIFINQLKHSLDQLEIARMYYEKKIVDASGTKTWQEEIANVCKPHIERIDKRIDEMQNRLQEFVQATI